MNRTVQPVLEAKRGKRTFLARYLAYLVFLILFALLLSGMTIKSPTMDEQNHIARGLAYLKTGDLRLSQEHPPGINAWEAWPLLLDSRIQLPLNSASWANAEWYGFADQFLWKENEHPQRIVFAPRVTVMWLTVLLAAWAYRWARELGGEWAGLIALGMTVFDPNLLAHGRLTTTDMGVTCLVCAAMWSLWQALRRNRWQDWVAAGAMLGATQLSKFSALTLFPVFSSAILATWIAEWIPQLRKGHSLAQIDGQKIVRRVAHLAAMLGTCFVVIWAGYRFTWGPIGPLNGVAGPAPAYWAGIQTLLKRTGGGTPAFLMGQYSSEGWWYYFPVAFALKTPLPTLFLLTLAAGSWMYRQRDRRTPRTVSPSREQSRRITAARLCLWLPLLAFWAIALAGSFNIGYRHIVPALPFLYILAGGQVGQWMNRAETENHRIRRFVTCGLCMLALTVSTIHIAPHYLAFFNAIAGGPDGGYRYLVDSNLDWGQDLPGLQTYTKTHNIDRLFLSWFGAAHPEAYDLSFHPLPGFWRFRGEAETYGFNPSAPAPGVYAISATNLQGLALADHDTYAWFRTQDPIARIGHSILIYRVQRETGNEESVVLGLPRTELEKEDQTLLQRISSIRRYEPSTGLIVPLADPSFWLITPYPPTWGQVVRQRPAYSVIQSQGWTVPSSQKEIRFSSFVTLIDHETENVSLTSDKTLLVRVGWRVEQSPHRAAKSFAHLLDPQGQYVAGWDGVTAPATCWQPGDVIRQRYDIPLANDLEPGIYQLEIGWYDTETQHRWPCSIDGTEVGDRLLLPQVEVTP